MDVTVAVATYGDRSWTDLAAGRAIPSAEALDVPVVYYHGDTLHEARNGALALVDTEWVCHLDADDELGGGYFDAIARCPADVKSPAVSYITGTVTLPPYVPTVSGHHHECSAECLTDGNWLVVGSVARTELVRRVGGWRDFPWSEDWDLWLRCHLAGATFAACPDAVYRAYVRPDSRNRAADRDVRSAAHEAIAAANGLTMPA